MQHRNAQSGSMLSYLLVAGLLTVLLVGGLFWVQRYKMGIDTPEVVVTQDEDKNSSKNNDTKPEADKPGSDAKSDDKKTESPKDADKAPAPVVEDKAPAATEPAKTEAVLPTTGPAETTAAAIASASLVYATALYVRSRRTIS